MVIHGVAVIVHEIVTVDVIHKAVAVIVHTIPGSLAQIDPHVLREVFVRVVDSRVDNRHNGTRTSGGNVPGFRSVDVRVGGSPRSGRYCSAPTNP